MKSFKNISILIKVQLFCLKNVFFSKKLLYETKKRFISSRLKQRIYHTSMQCSVHYYLPKFDEIIFRKATPAMLN